MKKKQSVLLGLREKLEKDFQNLLTDMLQKFTKKQGLFIGFRNTYNPIEGYADDVTKRGFQNVASTVEDQLAWVKQHAADYLKTTLSIEKTNAQGIKAHLTVDGEDWGEYTVLELLRMKGILDGKLRAVFQELPIRSESHMWSESKQPEFTGRKIWETPMDKGFAKTTIKDTIIINDPHIKDSPNRPPVTRETSIQVNVGEYTAQTFSGAITNLERAKLEVKYNNLYRGIIAALEEANNVEVSESDLGDRVLSYLF